MVWNFLRLASLRLTCVSQFKHEKTLCNPLHWKNYKCKICLATFAKSHQLSSHMDSHTKENKHKCSICSFSFRGKKSFKRHMWKQTGTQPFHCTFCSSSFSRKDVLNKHIVYCLNKNKNSTSQEKSHTCRVCLRQFSRAYDLKEHMRYHTGEKPYKCLLCNKSFVLSKYLKFHLKDHRPT